jgi:conjugative transposon TraM protein
MSINFKQPRYILPLVLLPFLCLFFYVYHSGASHRKTEGGHQGVMNEAVGNVSPEVKKRRLENKLDAYRNTYKDADGNSAVVPIPTDNPSGSATPASNIEKQKRMLDSVNQLMKQKYGARPGRAYAPPAMSEQDKQLAAALNNLSNRQKEHSADQSAALPKAKDPMETFRLQLAYMDSLRKANDPAYLAAKQKELALAKAAEMKAQEKTFSVVKAGNPSADFNTITPEKPGDFIKVIVDENITGYAGSRLRLRLLDDISVGTYLVKKDSYLYALINGFSGQRVTLLVKSIIYQDKILPVKLEVYDLDGLPGLYVPESAFRDFTKDLGQNTVQGVTIDDSGTGSVANQFMMSTVSKMFESTSSAVAGMIRKDKAKIKYNSYLYLIDTDNSKNK